MIANHTVLMHGIRYQKLCKSILQELWNGQTTLEKEVQQENIHQKYPIPLTIFIF